MYCVKVLFENFERSYKLKNVLKISKTLKVFSVWDSKVNSCSTAIQMKSEDLFSPPKNLNGMKVLDKTAFKKTITVPFIELENENFHAGKYVLKSYRLKILNLNPVQVIDDKRKKVLLNPCVVHTWSDIDEKARTELERLKINEQNLSKTTLELGYDNWNASTILKAVLPLNEPPLTSFALIGHIIHLNIKEHLLEYKHIIAEILLDKISLAKTVVYKKNKIDNVYRNFEMEVICGEPNLMASVKENGCSYEFDFSKVYWNPRLSTEHTRIVNLIGEKDVLFDVFAGVGPFAIPAAKKKCKVFANDLNPESFKWLNHNIGLQKKCENYITTFNKDGSDFILEDVKINLLKIWQDESFTGKIYVVMNLPALALTFLKNFKKLFTSDDLLNLKLKFIEKCLPIIYCYFFAMKSENKQEIFEQSSGIPLGNIEHNFFSVRDVSHGKVMYRVTFQLPMDYLLGNNIGKNVDSYEPLPKRICTS